MSRPSNKRRYVLIIEAPEGDPLSVDVCGTVEELAETLWKRAAADEYMVRQQWNKRNDRERDLLDYYWGISPQVTLDRLADSAAKDFVRGLGEYLEGLTKGFYGHMEWDSVDGRLVILQMMDEDEARHQWWYDEGDWSTSSRSSRRPSAKKTATSRATPTKRKTGRRSRRWGQPTSQDADASASGPSSRSMTRRSTRKSTPS